MYNNIVDVINDLSSYAAWQCMLEILPVAALCSMLFNV